MSATPLPNVPARRLFVDSSAVIALVNRSDHQHDAARRIETRLRAEHWSLFTTNFVRAETHAFLLNRLGRGIALQTIQRMSSSAFTLLRVEEQDEERALDILTRYRDKTFSFTDATSFAVMERLAFNTYFSFDRHFIQYGFRAIFADQP